MLMLGMTSKKVNVCRHRSHEDKNKEVNDTCSYD